MKTFFYTTYQNNSGGEYIINNDVSCYVIVEAYSDKEATRRTEEIVVDYSDYCPCCGVRWFVSLSEFDANHQPLINNYSKNTLEEDQADAIVYYLNGRKERYVNGVMTVISDDLNRIMELFKSKLSVEGYKEIFDKTEKQEFFQNNILQSYAYKIRSQMIEEECIDANELEYDLGELYVTETLNQTLNFVINNGLYIEAIYEGEEY